MTPVFIIIAVLVFGLLIATHELGHFIAAKLCGVKVNEYAIGMGPLLWSRQAGETLYSLRALPIGGFCAMEGEDEDTGSERSFVRQKAWKKFIILIAGVTMNFLTGLLILLAVSIPLYGYYTDEVASLNPDFPLQGENSLMSGDILYKLGGFRCYEWGDASTCLSFLRGEEGDTLDITVIRDGEKVLLKDIPMARREYTSEDGSLYTGFGINLRSHLVELNFPGKIAYAWDSALRFVQLVRFSLYQLFTGGASIRDLSGPVGIVNTMTQMGEAAESAADAALNIFYFAAFLAVNLAVMNLLPLPALDGGRIFFLLVDGIWLLLFRRTVPEKFQAVYNAVGLAALMGLMLVITAQDIWKLLH